MDIVDLVSFPSDWVSFFVLIAYLYLLYKTLQKLRDSLLAPTPQAIWVLIVLSVPLIGILAFYYIDPQPRESG